MGGVARDGRGTPEGLDAGPATALHCRRVKALRLDPTLCLADVRPPERGPGEARVRVRVAGICSTDLEIARGYMGFRGTLGHELVGEVLEADRDSLVGRRVTAEINLGCGRCAACARGLARHCPERTVLGIVGKDGCLAEEVTVPVGNLRTLPDTLADELAVFTEPVAACFEILEQLRVEPGARVAVLGDGKLGLLAALVLDVAGADVELVGKHARKRAIVERRGLRTRAPSEVQPAAYDVVVEATGAAEGFALATRAVRPRGTVVLKSTFHGATTFDAAKLVIDEITVVGSRCGPFAPAIRALDARRIDPAPLVDARYPLAEAMRAFEHAAQVGVLKILVDNR